VTATAVPPDVPGVPGQAGTGSDGEATAAKGSLALLASFALIAVLNYVFAILMSWLLPVEQFGVLGVAQAVILLGATITAAGFPWALARWIARLGDRSARAAAFRSALAGNLVLGGGVALVTLAVAGLGLLTPVSLYQPVLVAASVTIGVLAANAVLAGTLQGLTRLRDLGLVRAFEVLVKAVVGAALVIVGMGALGAVVGFLVGALLATAAAAWFLRDFTVRGGRPVGRAVLAATGPIFVAMSGFALLAQGDILTLKLFAPESSDFLAGQYQVAVTLARIPFFAAMALFGAVFPYVARSLWRRDLAAGYARLALKYTFLFIAPVTVVFVVLPEPVIRVFFSEKYDRSAGPLVYAAIATLLLTVAYGLAVLLQAEGEPGRSARAVLVGVPVEIVMAALLIPRMGMTGAAVALALAGGLVAAVLAPAAARRFALHSSPRAVAAYLLSLALLAVTLTALPHETRQETILALLGGGVVYLVSLTLLRLLTSADVRVLGGAIEPRGHEALRTIARLVDRVQLASDRRA
jgi:O-antigen/teichoic acid export membrane protein